MFKILEQIGGNWIERDGATVFHREATNDGGGRLRVSVPRDEAFLLFKLVECLRPPFQPLYAANAVGLSRGFVALDGRHQHQYRREFDREAAEVLSSFNRS